MADTINKPMVRPEILKMTALVLIVLVAFATRLFSVLRFESVIHEFDPYFNYRSTVQLVKEGFYAFWNWFDDKSWYPLGRIVGGTVYPGLMWTSGVLYYVLNFLNITINVRNICVFLAPVFASLTCIVTYLFTKEINGSDKQGLVAAALVAIVPGYISRSVAGSYDNEGIAIFALILTFYLWLKAVNTGTMYWGAMCALAYFYMVSAWGGYIFIINLIPLYVFVSMLAGRYSRRMYVAYTTMYVLGTMLSMQITFVGFQAVQSSEHMAALGVFILLQVYGFVQWIRSVIDDERAFKSMAQRFLLAVGVVLATALTVASATGYISPWTGRFYSLLDPTYAKEHIPIIASVSEHQPTTWASFFFDLHMLTIMFPVGIYYTFNHMTDGGLFIILYGMTAVYFAGVMVRLMLVLAPVACVLSAIAISRLLELYCADLQAPVVVEASNSTPSKKKAKKTEDWTASTQREVALVMVAVLSIILAFYVVHCTWVTSEAYSSPSIVLAARQHDGSRMIFDDFREAYYWLRMNTDPSAKVMSWWDYGYQISSMANRTTIVDNNTWNNTHIATVGKAMASDEETAYKIMRRLDVDYVLVLFGGLTGYASDDINKFLWMVRIGGSVDKDVKEADYYTAQGEFKIDRSGSPMMLNSLMYKMCYYRFGDMYTEHGKPTGWDRVRNCEIGNKQITLEHIEEAYTTEHWLVRIYKVKKPENRF